MTNTMLIFEGWPHAFTHGSVGLVPKPKVSSDQASALGEFRVGKCCQENYFSQCIFTVKRLWIFNTSLYERVRECD